MFKAFHAPRDIYGPNVFQMFVHELGGPKSVSRYLGVSERSLRRWLLEGNVPRAAVLALYWETQYGRSQIYTEQVNEIRMLCGRVRLLQDQFARARDIVAGLRKLHSGGANEPVFEEMAMDMDLPQDNYGANALSAIKLAIQSDGIVVPTEAEEKAQTAEAIRLVIEQARTAVAKANRRRKTRAA